MDDPTDALFERWPAPWAYDENRTGHEGYCTVFDANGNFVVMTGDMENCTMAEIRLGQAFAALPALLELARAVATDYEDAAEWKDARSRLLSLAQTALGHFDV